MTRAPSIQLIAPHLVPEVISPKTGRALRMDNGEAFCASRSYPAARRARCVGNTVAGSGQDDDAMERMGGGSERRVWAERNAVEGRQQGVDMAAPPPWRGESEGLCRGRGRAVSE